MNCYNHHSVPAVAICKNCNKGLCPECLTEVKNGIACTATCVEEVETVNAMINKNKNAGSRVASTYYRMVFMFLAMSLLFLYSAFETPSLKFYMFPASGIFFAMSLLYLNTANKYKKDKGKS
jgi:hypothetical protein